MFGRRRFFTCTISRGSGVTIRRPENAFCLNICLIRSIATGMRRSRLPRASTGIATRAAACTDSESPVVSNCIILMLSKPISRPIG